MILRRTYLTTGSPQTEDERWYILQNWRNDPAVTLTDAGVQVERVRFSPYGEAFGIPSGDLDFNGEATLAEEILLSNWESIPLAYQAYADINLDGVIDAADAAAASGATMGRGVLSHVGSKIGYAGYTQDAYIPTVSHVRHRVYKSDLGRWVQRDPAGYVDGPSLYEYAMSAPVRHRDPMGLAVDWDGPSGPGGGPEAQGCAAPSSPLVTFPFIPDWLMCILSECLPIQDVIASTDVTIALIQIQQWNLGCADFDNQKLFDVFLTARQAGVRIADLVPDNPGQAIDDFFDEIHVVGHAVTAHAKSSGMVVMSASLQGFIEAMLARNIWTQQDLHEIAMKTARGKDLLRQAAKAGYFAMMPVEIAVASWEATQHTLDGNYFEAGGSVARGGGNLAAGGAAMLMGGVPGLVFGSVYLGGNLLYDTVLAPTLDARRARNAAKKMRKDDCSWFARRLFHQQRLRESLEGDFNECIQKCFSR